MLDITRRTALAGMASLAAARPALAEETSPVAHGMLADNKLAKAFVSARATLPDVKVVGLDGTHDLSSLIGNGRTVLMPIWAEWCAPCLKEIPDFALLQRQFGNDKFAIIPVLSAPRKKVTPDALADVFKILQASVFQPLIEDHFGGKLANAMARKNGAFYIPCNVLIAPDGHVIGREIGLEANPAAEEERRTSLWGSADGQEFAAVISGGFYN
jgi:thiol-disulfide isomerase/thioredoxin